MEKNISKIKAPRLKRSIPTIIYPQILVLVDYGNFKLEKKIIIIIANYLNH